MAIEFKDYYRILGIPRSAPMEEIRKAFRQLARQHHPDVAQDRADADGRFREINEAYEVLGDPIRRKQYDALGADWKPGADFRPPPGWASNGQHHSGPKRGTNFEFQFRGTGFSDFFEQIFGSRGGRGHTQTDRATESHRPHTTVQRGEDIESDIVVSLQEALRGSIRPISIQHSQPCRHCHGAGLIQLHRCPCCQGQGQVTQIEKYQVKIPVGVRHGQRLRLPGRGDPGPSNHDQGDLFLRVRFEKHPYLHAENEHLIHELDVAPWEAVLGAQICVPTLEGRVNIRIPPGSQHGQRFRLRGHGLPTTNGERGDVFAVLRIQVPAVLDDRERRLWEKLARDSSFRARVVR